MKKIPEKFYNVGLKAPSVNTVGSLIKSLQELPLSLSFNFGLADNGLHLVVYNHGEEDMYASLEEDE